MEPYLRVPCFQTAETSEQKTCGLFVQLAHHGVSVGSDGDYGNFAEKSRFCEEVPGCSSPHPAIARPEAF